MRKPASAAEFARRLNDRVAILMGSSYSWRGELYYRGDPCVARATDYEEALLEKAVSQVQDEIRSAS